MGDNARQPASVVEAWRARVEQGPGEDAISYFDTTLSARQVDEMSDALAAGLAERGVRAGTRVGIMLQNVPHYALGLLGAWKLGAVPVLLNPMYFGAELVHLVRDSGAAGIIATDRDCRRVREDVADTDVEWILSVDEKAFPSAGNSGPADGADDDLLAVVEAHAGAEVPAAELDAHDLAMLTYTSGTTGPPKGAMNSHGNVVTVATTFGDYVGVERGDVVFALAPLFHITGAVINAALGLISGANLVFTGRFEAGAVLEAFRQHRVTFTIGSITAFNALMQLEHASEEHFASVKALYSGGAPIPPSTVERFENRFGHYIHNAYGMTETTSGVIGVPLGRRAPVDPASGTLSIGLPLPGLRATVVDFDGSEVEPGTQGELVLSGPQVVSGYWNNPEATEKTMAGGKLHTGDGAVIDEDGWVYLVDRIKDQINTSGYKVWPREVEDVLYQHPAVYEAAVVGAPDDYRGEKVVAFVSLDPASGGQIDDLDEFVAERLAAYKRPREITVVDDLPKTQTGKIRRRALRDGE